MDDKKAGRPPKVTASEVRRALEECNGVLTDAAHVLGVSRHTIGRALERHPSLRDVIREQREALGDRVEHTISGGLELEGLEVDRLLVLAQATREGTLEEREAAAEVLAAARLPSLQLSRWYASTQLRNRGYSTRTEDAQPEPLRLVLTGPPVAASIDEWTARYGHLAKTVSEID